MPAESLFRRGPFRERPRPPHRLHGQTLQHDRRELEQAGWRTTLEYRENHVRGRDGSLEQLHVIWHAEAERVGTDGVVRVVSATASTPARVWSRLRVEADLAEVRARRTDLVADLARL
ncbi:MAG: hypothetical protein ACE37B_22725 [Ilumatobacter sp.]|uniref:hypothetical protein n=1 Tax=Ilumatobacter sp. TaxID=1967498 RepID=UPI00391B72E1